MACDPNTLLHEARCFNCLTEDQRAIITLSLLCQIANSEPPPPSFSPSDIEGLTAWFKADSLALADDDPVSVWVDGAGTADAVQATAALQPLFKTAIQNGLPVVRFDGADDAMQTAAWAAPLVQPYTTVITFRLRFIDAGFPAIITGLLGTGFATIYQNAGDFKIYANTASTLEAADTDWHILIVEWNQASSKYRMDGAAEIGVTTPGFEAPAGLTLGNNESLSGPSDVDLAELCIYDGLLSTQQQDDLIAYMNNRWAVF